MKTKRDQRHKGATGQGKGVSAGYKAPPRQDKQTPSGSAHVPNKPLAGKVFYLDLPSNRITDTLESNIRELGGTVEKFFSKEIKYLVSNKREARYMRCLKRKSSLPDSAQSSPHPCSNPHQGSSHGDNIKSRCQDQTDTLVRSRGKSLLEKVVKGQSVQINKILSNALEWGVKILYIDDVVACLTEKKKKLGVETKEKKGLQKCKGGRLSKPCVKVEDSSRHYRPIYFTLPNMPQINLRTPPPYSPFLVDDKDPPGNKRRGHRINKASASEERAHGRKRNRDKKGGGYCECCAIKYESLSRHLKSEYHRTFSKSNKYLVLDKLISTMRCDFIHLRNHFQRPKSSVSSVVVAPGPCVKTEPRPKPNLDTAETINEQQEAVNGQQTLKTRAAPASSGLAHRGGQRRSNDTFSDGSRHKSAEHKQLCRQNSSISCPRKEALPKKETAPSSGDYFESVPCRVESVDLAGQMTTENANGSSSHFHNNETNQRVDSHHKLDSSMFTTMQYGNMLQDKISEATVSEKQEGSILAPNSSPVRTIQRRIRVSERKRQKLDKPVEHLQPCNITDDSRLKLFEIFQSSDDTDMEFLGFES
ncbi:protein DBF4 homolog A isoform X2 [Nelusetta ayraudi]|uniref:protein DBF4 homolog A isoform X2 n=1 Tax=Nelusetta ayraudi TaxID=303726 RepID=UPI003F72ABD6